MSSPALLRSAEYEPQSGHISTELGKGSLAGPRSAWLCSLDNYPGSGSSAAHFLSDFVPDCTEYSFMIGSSLGSIHVLWRGLLGGSTKDARSSGSPGQLLVAPAGLSSPILASPAHRPAAPAPAGTSQVGAR